MAQIGHMWAVTDFGRNDRSAEHGPHPEVAKQLLVDRRVEAISTEVGPRCPLANTRYGFDRNSCRGVHGDIDGNELGLAQQIPVEAFD